MGFSKFIGDEGIRESLNLKEQSYGYIAEASFSSGKLHKVAELYGKILGKKLGGKFYILGEEQYKRASGPGIGIRCMNNKGVQLRFNYDNKLAKHANYVLTSMDYWEETNRDFQRPSRTATFGADLNVVNILSVLAKSFKVGKLVESDSSDMDYLNDPDIMDEMTKKDWVKSRGYPDYLSSPSYEKNLRKRAEKDGISEELNLILGMPEKNSFEGEITKAENNFDKVYANPDTVFDDIESLLSLVASGKWRTLIICGMGGIGKTYHVTEGDKSLEKILGPAGDKWTYHSGTKAAPFSFYKTLYQERDKIIVFDEADSLLKNKDIVMMLKPILDTSGDNLAEYMSSTANMVGKTKNEINDYCTQVDMELADGKSIGTGSNDVLLPSKFEFTGGMIFISNMKSEEIEEAIMSRSIFVDVYLAAQDVEKRIRTIGMAQAKSDPDLSDAEVEKVLKVIAAEAPTAAKPIQYMTPEYARKSKQLTVRALKLGIIMMKAKLPDWERLASMYA